jgi:hypothetical protein
MTSLWERVKARRQRLLGGGALLLAGVLAWWFRNEAWLPSLGLIAAGAAIILRRSPPSPPTPRPSRPARRALFWLQISYLLVIFLLGIWYWQGGTVRFWGFPPVNLYCSLPNPIGALPLEVVWFGALGGVVANFESLYRGQDANPDFRSRAISRPFVGAAMATVAYFLAIVAVQATGSQPVIPGANANARATSTVGVAAPASAGVSTTATVAALPTTTRRCVSSKARPMRQADGRPSIPPPDPGAFTYFALAFVVGYQEDVFRRLVRRVTEVILAPGGVTPSTPARVVLQRSPDGSIAAEQPYSLVAIVLDGANRPIDESVPVVFELTRAANDGGAAQKATFVQDTQGGRATQVVPGAGSSVGRAPGRFEAKAAAGTVASDPVTLEWI